MERPAAALLLALGAVGCRPAASSTSQPLAAGAEPVASASGPTVVAQPAAPQAVTTSSIAAYARLLPDTLPMVMGLDIQALRGTKVWADNYERIAASQAEDLARFEACDLGPQTWRGVVIGFTADPGARKRAAVVVVQGIGRPATLDCLVEQIITDDGEPRWRRSAEPGVFEREDGNRLFVVDDDTIVATDGELSDAVQLRIRSGGRSALDADLQPALPRADTTRHWWIVGRMDDANATPLAGDQGRPKDIAAWLDLSFGARLFVAVGFEDPTAAAAVHERFTPQLQSLRSMSAGLGIPTSVAESTELGIWGAAVTLSASASPHDLQVLVEQVIQQMASVDEPEVKLEPPMKAAD